MAQQFIGASRYAQRTAGAATNANFSELYARHLHLVLDGTTANTTFVVPKGYLIEHVGFFNTTANAVTGGVKLGITSGGTEAVTAQPVGANVIDTIPGASFNKRLFSSTADTTVYLQAVTNWNSASVNFRVELRRMF